MQATTVSIETGAAMVRGELALPPDDAGLVVLSNGSDGGGASSNAAVAAILQERGFGTLVLDLLMPDEQPPEDELELLGNRLVGVTDWLSESDLTATRPVGLFGSSTAAAAAFIAAAERPERISAIVSDAGRTDLVMEYLDEISAPTLLIVDDEDEQALDANRAALGHLTTLSDMQVILDASEDTAKAGTKRRAGELAADWFAANLTGPESSLDPPPVSGTGGMTRFGDTGREDRAIDEGRGQRRSRN